MRWERAWCTAVEAKHTTLATFGFCFNHLSAVPTGDEWDAVIGGHFELFFLVAMRAGYSTF